MDALPCDPPGHSIRPSMADANPGYKTQPSSAPERFNNEERSSAVSQAPSSLDGHDDVSSLSVKRHLGSAKTETQSSISGASPACRPALNSAAASGGSDISFSRHDSLFSFGVPSSRNAAELKSFLGNSNSRLKPGAAVLPLQAGESDKRVKSSTKRSDAVSLEQAKARARVEVDIVLENDCCVEGGYLRGLIKIRVRKRQKKDAPVLLADGKVRVIGFESIPGESDRHTFYQRASSLRNVTDTYAGVFDSSPDAEGFSHALEGVHALPFAMHLPVDSAFGSAKGLPCLQGGVSIRYIAMISVKVKDSKTGKRSIAHFYRDCQVWPRLDSAIVLASAPRPIQASTAKSLSVIGGGSKVKLTAVLPRMTWVAGQRCYVHLSVVNDTRRTVKSLTLTLVRTTTLFKPKPVLDYGHRSSVDPDACQTATAHKVVAESTLERSQGAAKGHASAQGWWTGVGGGQEAQFSHFVVIPPDALSVIRARLIEVEYSIRVSLSAGTLTSDVQVTLPVRIVNFLSLDPTGMPSAPLLSTDGSYARLVPRATGDDESETASVESLSTEGRVEVEKRTLERGPGSALCAASADSSLSKQARGQGHGEYYEGLRLRTTSGALQVVNPDRSADTIADERPALQHASESDSSLYSIESSASAFSCHGAFESGTSTSDNLGNLDLSDGADSDDEVDLVLRRSARTKPTASHDSSNAKPSGVPESEPLADEAGGWKSSVRSSYIRPTHGRPAGPRRSTSEPSAEDGQDASRTVTAGPTTAVNSGTPVRPPVRPDRSPLRALAGRRAIERPVDAAAEYAQRPREGLTSFERRVQEKKLALLGAPVEHYAALHLPRIHTVGETDASASAHSQNGAGIGSCQGADEHIDDDSDVTPKLGYHLSDNPATAFPRSAVTLHPGHTSSHLSRELPLPPPRASQLSQFFGAGNIPHSVSALESLRASHLCGQPAGSALRRPAAPGTGLPAGVPPPLVASTSKSSSGQSAGSAESLPRDADADRLGLGAFHHRRPTKGMYDVGLSDDSIVKGRIAVFEERLKVSEENGAAYA